MEGQHAQSLWEAALVPALSGFALCLGAILFAAWKPAPRPPAWHPLDRGARRSLLRATVRLAVAGWLAFLVIVLTYSWLLQHEPEAITAVWAAPFLLAVASLAWTAFTALANRFVADRPRRNGERLRRAIAAICGGWKGS